MKGKNDEFKKLSTADQKFDFAIEIHRQVLEKWKEKKQGGDKTKEVVIGADETMAMMVLVVLELELSPQILQTAQKNMTQDRADSEVGRLGLEMGMAMDYLKMHLE